MSSTASSGEMHAPSLAAGRPGDRGVAIWLLACCALVFAMAMIGTVPPLDDSSWQDAFRKYQQTPEFLQINPGMELAGFKRIFWWEYVHRLLGRLIGAAFLLPLLWFAVRGRIGGTLTWKLAAIFALGALQGAMGWAWCNRDSSTTRASRNTVSP